MEKGISVVRNPGFMLYFVRTTQEKVAGGCGAVQPLTPDIFWRLFQSTGSIWAYLAYRRFASIGPVLLSSISLN